MSEVLSRRDGALDDLTRQVRENDLARAKVLDTLVTQLGIASAEGTGGDFRVLFDAAQQVLHLDDLALSRILKVSRPTVGRWVRGVSAPHPLARKAIFNVLSGSARAEAKSLRG